MKISADEVRYIGDLANLRLSPQETEKYRADLEEILTYVEKLNELDTSEVEPMAQVIYPRDKANPIRTDEPKPSFDPEFALRSAPSSGAGHFKVPKVIER